MTVRKHKHVYIAPPQYAIDSMPGYLQKQYRQGHGYIEVRPSLDREYDDYYVKPRGVRPYLERENKDLWVDLTPWEKKQMRLSWLELQNAPTLEEMEKAEKAELRRKRRKIDRMNRYIRDYFIITGLAKEARRAGVGLKWLLIDNPYTFV